ncbi:hypothetical protein [Nocardioides sp.]|uniref:hypothetical protein n=1 Tax=Nocardioides sp. TaxID=35761 RepID=UPI0023925457|nr:hypothetical protein [Nocardioides sp.]MDE0775753.1 hypothetical protein [Nocardioides sp.]
MDDLMPRRRRVSGWVLVALAILINLPVATSTYLDWRLSRSGVDVEAVLVDSQAAGEGGDGYALAFTFDPDIDPEQTVWTAPVTEAAFDRAVRSEVVRARVLPDRPSAYEVEGEVTSGLGWLVTGFADACLLAMVLLLRRGGQERLLQLVALEDVQRHLPGAGPRTGFEDLGGETYLVVGEICRIEDDAVVVDAGERRVRVRLGPYDNRVGYQQPGRVTARLSD